MTAESPVTAGSAVAGVQRRQGLWAIDAQWLAALHARVAQPPRKPRLPLFAAGSEIGSIEPEVAGLLLPLRLTDGTALLIRQQTPASPVLPGQTGQRDLTGLHVQGDASAGLHALALALRDAGLSHAWRDEQLAVRDPQGRCIASVERAVVRVLGIATQAVHLVGFDEQGHVWLQQRAWTKPNDPGLWDTLMGGMVSAADSVDTALARETWEEAGLQLAQLRDLRHGGQVTLRRPAADGGGTGYVIEQIAWSACTLPAGIVPMNQDGEVDRFECLSPVETVARMERDEFTDEAALILAAALGH